MTVPAVSAPGSYTYRAVTAAAAGAPAFASYRTMTVLPDTTAPGLVSALTATAVSTTEITLGWANPTGDFTGVTIRRAEGPAAPATLNDGTEVTIEAGPVTSFIEAGLDPAKEYSYAVFAHDGSVNYAVAAANTATTNGPG